MDLDWVGGVGGVNYSVDVIVVVVVWEVVCSMLCGGDDYEVGFFVNHFGVVVETVCSMSKC